MNGLYRLDRFEKAQAPVYETVLQELKRGRKQTHWMWFIFPQIQGLGYSETSRRFAISSIEEAKAYLAHPILGNRLRECTRLVLEIKGRTAEQVFGSIDSSKLRSSMTLFLQASDDNQIFRDVLSKYFDNQPDKRTMEILQSL